MTFADIILNAADDNGTIRWSTACQAAKEHSLWDDFRTEYSSMVGQRVDAGEFLVWLGY